MSLDFCLEGQEAEVPCRCDCCGHMHTRIERACYFDRNITHNLGRMAEVAGVYEVLWRSQDFRCAGDLVEPLREGLRRLKAAPAHFEQFNAPNGWGLYEHFVPFVEACLQACEEYPDAIPRSSR